MLIPERFDGWDGHGGSRLCSDGCSVPDSGATREFRPLAVTYGNIACEQSRRLGGYAEEADSATYNFIGIERCCFGEETGKQKPKNKDQRVIPESPN